MKKHSLIFIICMLTHIISSAQSTEEKAVADAVENLRKAMVDADKAALENLAANELTYGHSSGRIEDKASFVQAIATRQSDFKSITLSDQTLTVSGSTAIVRHKLYAETNDGGKPGTVTLHVLLVWTKQQKDWKLLARQAVKLSQ